jgi:hypothetical protein
VPFEFGNDFCTPCEPIARVWHKGNDPIGRRPIAVDDVVDVDLPEIHAISLLSRYLAVPLTILAAFNVPPLMAMS